MRYFLKDGDDFQTVDVVHSDGSIAVTYNGKNYTVDLQEIADGHYSVLLDNRSMTVQARPEEGGLAVVRRHVRYDVPILNQRRKMEREVFGGAGEGARANEVKAPMPGMVLRLEVKPGDAVTPGQPLLVIEAMKMENEIRAVGAGTVAEILVKPDQAVERNDLLLRLED